MKSYLVAMAVGVLLFVSGILFYQRHQREERIAYQTKMVSMIQDVLKLAIVDVQVSQMFEMKKDAIRMMNVPIPLTAQKSLVIAEGKATLGYDLHLATFTASAENKSLAVRLPAPMVMALDLNYRFVFENDTFLNRITTEDRNETLETIKESVRTTIMKQDYQATLRARVDELTKEMSAKFGLKIMVE